MAKKKLSRVDRWMAAANEAEDALRRLLEVQEEYQGWLDTLPEYGMDTVREKLEAVTELDVESAADMAADAAAAELPLGFGRD